MRPPVRLNHDELDALKGLPHAARIVYVEGIRPFMDFRSGVVGASNSPDKSISLQSLAEVLYVEPKPGRTGTGSRSRKQARVCIDVLIDSGLLSSMSVSSKHDKRLVLKCLLASTDESVQKKQGTNRAQEQGTNRAQRKHRNVAGLDKSEPMQQGTAETPQQGTPPGSVITDSHRQTPRAREKSQISLDFSIDEQMRTLLMMAGISAECAEFMLPLFVSDNHESQYQAKNWRSEFITYIRRFGWKWEQHQKGKHLVSVKAAVGQSSKPASDVAKGFTTMEDYDDGEV